MSAIVHNLVRFDATLATQSEIAKWGIMSHFGLIPAASLLVAALVFWRYWDLTPERMENIKRDLEKQGL